MGGNKKIMAVFGTRPEAIKMCPLIKELRLRDGMDVKICLTGQHMELTDEVMGIFDEVADHRLDLMKTAQTLSYVTARVLEGFGEILDSERPDIVLVHGDTTTAFASCLAAFYRRIPVGLAAVLELCAPDATYAYRGAVHELLVVEYREAVALLNTEEIDGPLVYILKLRSKGVGQVLLHNSTP